MKKTHIILSIFILLSLAAKLLLIFTYQNQLTLSSDDLNYVKSAVVLLKRGIFVFHQYNEPTVYVMPLYPAFLAAVFKVFGCGLAGMQAVRVIQALLSSVAIIYAFLIAKDLFNAKIGLLTAFLVSFYMPNISTVGYVLTETLFTTLLTALIYYSIKFAKEPGNIKFIMLGILWTAATLCRPTIALYPALLFLYILLYIKPDFLKLIRMGLMMLIPFIIIMTPWWIRNYREYNTFIPLAASSGNPMLQGTYVNYRQTPDNIVFYEIGKNTFETNKNEVKAAKLRMKNGFTKNFWGYLGWYTLGKTFYFWFTIFYWKSYFGIYQYHFAAFHYILIFGFTGIFMLLLNNFHKYILPVLVIFYFNVIHCIYMAFDRYAFPVLPILSVFCALFLYKFSEVLIKAIKHGSTPAG